MNRIFNASKLVRVPVLMDVRTYVQLAGKAKKRGVSVVKHNSDMIVASVSSPEKVNPKGRS